MAESHPYNPLDKINLGDSVVRALLERQALPLEVAGQETGAGVYVLYYSGNFPEYTYLAAENRDEARTPIYLGKAIPKGGRKGGIRSTSARSKALSKRLLEHCETVQQVSGLNISDFRYRALMLDDIWIPLAENMLIDRYKPLWNVAIDGFGNHAPGAGRKDQDCSPWDVLHVGRSWAQELRVPLFTRDDVIGRVRDHFEGKPLRQLPRRKRSKAEPEEEQC